MKVREVIPHIGPIPIVNPLKLFLESIEFFADYECYLARYVSFIFNNFTTANHNHTLS